MEFVVLLGTPLLGRADPWVYWGRAVGRRKSMSAFRWSHFSRHVRSPRGSWRTAICWWRASNSSSTPSTCFW